MSGNTDWTLIVRASAKAQAAAEGAMDISQRLQTDLGHRFSALESRLGGLEGRFTALEGRVTTLAAGQDSLHRAVLKIADIQADHTAQLTAIETTLAAILARLP